MGANHKIVVIKVVPSLMMQHLDSFGLKNKFLSVLTKMVMGKMRFEQWLYDQCVCEVKPYHGDNRIFSMEEFWRDCEDEQQS